VKMSTEHVLFDVAPVKELMNQYNQTIGSGLVVPETPVPSLKISD